MRALLVGLALLSLAVAASPAMAFGNPNPNPPLCHGLAVTDDPLAYVQCRAATWPATCGGITAVDDPFAYQSCASACLPDTIEKGVFDVIFDDHQSQIPDC
jgi:hypothetical protein